MGVDALIRPAVVADIAAIAAIHVAAWRESYAGMAPDALLASLSASRREALWKSILEGPAAFNAGAVFVAEHMGRVVGFGSCGPQRSHALRERGFEGEINAIYVERTLHGRGVGRALFTSMVHTLREMDLDGMGLWVVRANQRARRFYMRVGGRRVAEPSNLHQDGVLHQIAYGWRNLSALAPA